MNLLRNMKIGKRLGIGFGAIVVLLLGMTATALVQLANLNRLMDEAAKETQKSLMAAAIGEDVRDIKSMTVSILVYKEKAQKDEILKSLQAVRERYKKRLEQLKAEAKTQEGKELLSRVEQSLTDAREANNRAIEFSMAGKDAEAGKAFTDQAAPLYDKIFTSVADVQEWRQKRLQEYNAQGDAIYSSARWILATGGTIAVILAIVFGIVLTRGIVGPVNEGLGFAAAMAAGDMTQTLHISQTDEIGHLAKALNEMATSMRTVVTDINSGVHTLASSSTELSAISNEMAGGVREMSQKASTVAAAAEESSANTASVAAGMEQMTTNLSSVASATEQMSATIGEIASNSEKARSISTEATHQAEAVSAIMKELGRAAQEIGQVTETITSISAQTNLLALNATIEAARAGAAGKGFAVVANEIKELAQQTASATEDIKAKISNIQLSTGSAIGDIEKIAQIIRQVGEIVATIAAAIEEQSVVTKDVASNIAQASMGVKDSNDRVSQTATVSHSIAQDIAMVNATIDEISRGGEQVSTSSAELSRLAERLEELVSRFKV